MSLKDQLTADLKDAMKSGNNTRKTTIRGVRAAIKENEQRKREDLVKKALSKHNVERPRKISDEEAMAAYNKAVDAAVEAEKVEENCLLDDSEILGVIQKLVKQQQESIADADRAGRDDLKQEAGEQMAILQGYLPKQATREEIEVVARKVIAETGAESMRDMGKIMGPLMAALQGKADGKLVSEVVRSLLS
ncbi:MAG: GatB/YqeY domain-containing protein [Anaerolineae bacterium]|nr:GatB/YqeY domain-containing protein [Anaerolineae bacterium]